MDVVGGARARSQMVVHVYDTSRCKQVSERILYALSPRSARAADTYTPQQKPKTLELEIPMGSVK